MSQPSFSKRPTPDLPQQEAPAVAAEPVFESLGNRPTGTVQETPSQEPASPRPSKPDPFPAGTKIADRYVVERPLGTGGMGSVYLVIDELATQTDKDRLRALKFMSVSLANEPKAVQRFLSEAKSRQLSHPHIVQTIDINLWAKRNLLYITMEHVPGQNLRQHLKAADPTGTAPQPPFELTTTLELIRQLLAALVYAHASTIHRDIKPENLLVVIDTDSGRPLLKLTDFGIARQFDDEQSRHTQGAIGTPEYMAPEQRKGVASITARADLYSVGVVVYELLTGQIPKGRFKAASQLDPRIPKSLDDIIDRAMAPDPADRFTDASWMLAEIETVLKSLTQKLDPLTVQPTDLQLRNVDFSRLVIELEQRRAPC